MRTIIAIVVSISLIPTTALAGSEHPIQRTDSEAVSWAIEQAGQDAAVIRSEQDLLRHLEGSPASPLFRLDSKSRNLFISSLVFTKHGLASFSMTPFDGISVSDAHDILALFGRQADVAAMRTAEPRNASEEAMLILSTAAGADVVGAGPLPPAQDHYCRVGGGIVECVYEPRSYCAVGCN